MSYSSSFWTYRNPRPSSSRVKRRYLTPAFCKTVLSLGRLTIFSKAGFSHGNIVNISFFVIINIHNINNINNTHNKQLQHKPLFHKEVLAYNITLVGPVGTYRLCFNFLFFLQWCCSCSFCVVSFNTLSGNRTFYR